MKTAALCEEARPVQWLDVSYKKHKKAGREILQLHHVSQHL